MFPLKREYSLDDLSKLGVDSAKFVLYVNNTPIWSLQNPLDIPALITANGNHWRKICTIFAKLVSGDEWRDYRDNQLLKARELMCFTPQLHTDGAVHIFSGKESWKLFESIVTQLTETQDYESIAQGKVTYKVAPDGKLFIFTPYFDSRQFPNALIAQVKEQLLSSI